MTTTSEQQDAVLEALRYIGNLPEPDADFTRPQRHCWYLAREVRRLQAENEALRRDAEDSQRKIDEQGKQYAQLADRYETLLDQLGATDA